MAATDWLPSSVRAAAIERRLNPGQTLFYSGSKSTGFYEVVTGTVRLIRVDRSGREAVLQVASAGDTLAEASLFSPTYHCDAVATTEATVRKYPKAALLATRLERRNIHSARDRVRHFLTVNVNVDGRTVVLSGTLKQLAADLGLTHEALYRTLARMEAEREITRTGTTIKINRMT